MMAAGPSPARSSRAPFRWISAARSPAGWFVVGLAAALLVILRGPLGSVADPSEHGELVILSGQDDSYRKVKEALIDKWNREHPDVRARVEWESSIAEQQHSHMRATAQSGGPVDIYNLDVTWVPEFAAAGYIRPLDDHKPKGFVDAALATCWFDDRLWALPFTTDVGLLYYRTDLTDGAHLPGTVPPQPADLRPLLAKDRNLVEGYAGQFWEGYEGLTVNALEAIWSAGGDVVSPRGDVLIRLGETRNGLQRLAEAVQRKPGDDKLNLKTLDETSSATAFAQGKVALMRNWPVQWDKIANAGETQDGAADVRQHFNVARLPGTSVLGGQDLAIASTSQHPEAARRLIDFLTGEESQRKLFMDGGFAPVLNSVYADGEVGVKRPYAGVLLDAIKHARARPVTTHYFQFSLAFREIARYAIDHNGQLPIDAEPRISDALQGRR